MSPRPQKQDPRKPIEAPRSPQKDANAKSKEQGRTSVSPPRESKTQDVGKTPKDSKKDPHPQASGDAPDKSKKVQLDNEEPEEPALAKTSAQIQRENAEYRAMLRRARFKRRWPVVSKVRLHTRPWQPPPPPQKPPPVVVALPELQYRKWVPPYLRRRRHRPRLVRIPPENISQPLPEVAKLKKVWHNFVQVEPNRMMLQGTLACNTKKYSSTSCGSQTACIAVVCSALLHSKSPAQLVRSDVDELIAAGDRFYRRCLQAIKCYKGKPHLEPHQLLPSFYLHDTKYSVKLHDPERGLLAKQPDDARKVPDLMEMMSKRQATTYMSLLSIGNTKHFLIWGHPPEAEAGSSCNTVCYIFDPHMLDDLGYTNSLNGAGAFLRFPGVHSFVVHLLTNHAQNSLDINSKKAPSLTVALTNIEIVQVEPLLRSPRLSLDVKALKAHCYSEWEARNNNALYEAKAEGQYPLGSISAVSLAMSHAKSRRNINAFYQKLPKEAPPALPVPPERAPVSPTTEELLALRGEDFFLYCPKPDEHNYGRDDLVPYPKTEMILHSPVEVMDANFHSQYKRLGPDKFILRGTRHMASLRYYTFKWYTGVPCVVSAIATLQRLRARAWCEDTVDETLDLGYNLYRESLEERHGPIRRIVLGEVKETFHVRDKECKQKTRGVVVWGRLLSNNPLVLDLCRGLEQFFKEADTGLLQVPGEYEVGIWNEGGKFYLYHPWPADAQGYRVGLQDGGKACIMYFTSVTALCEHFLESVRDMKRKPFSISDVMVTEQRDTMPEPVGNMKPVGPNKWIVRGHFHSGDERFSEQHRGRQATPTSIAALAMSHVVAPEEWTAEDVDETLVRGDALYHSTMENLEKLGISLDAPPPADTRYEELEEEQEDKPADTLAPADVLSRFKVSDFDCIETEVLDTIFTGSLSPHAPLGVPSLRAGLSHFFSRDNSHGVFTARGISTAIWKKDGYYYMFDPQACDENGVPSDTAVATAALMRVKGSVNSLAELILGSLPPGTDDNYTITPVLVTATKLNPEIGAPETKLESNAYQWIRKGTAAIMMGPRGENTAIGKANTRCFLQEDTSGRTLALPAVAFFAVASDSIPPPHMHQDHMYNFIDAAADYYLDHVKQTGRKELGIEDLTEKFPLGANTYSLELGEPTRLPLRLQEPEGEEEEAEKEAIGEQEETEILKEMKDLLFKMWYDTTKPTSTSLLLGDYHQLGVWMAAGGKVIAFDPAPTVFKGLLTSHRVKKGDELRLQRLKDEMPAEAEVEEEELEGEGEEKPEAEVEPVPPESCPVLMVAASPGEFIDKLVFQGGLNKQQALAPYKLYPVKVTNELTVTLKERRQGALGAPQSEEDVADEEQGEALVPALNDEALSEHFVRASRGVASVRGRLAQDEKYFQDYPNRDYQDAANSVMGIVVDSIEPYTYWKSSLVDAILKYGDRLHTVSLPQASSPPHIKPEELLREFHVTHFNVSTEIQPDVVTGDIKAGETGTVLNLRRGLNKFFQTANKYGVVCAKKYCVGLWRGADGQSFALWEPHAVGPGGRASPGGAAGLVMFSTVEELAAVLKHNIDERMKPGNSRFSIAAVNVTWQLDPTPAPPRAPGVGPDEGYENKVLTAFVETARGRTILRGSLPQNTYKFSRSCLIQSSCAAIVSTCISHLRRPALWTRRTVDDAIAAAVPLYHASTAALGYEFRQGEDVLLPLQVLQRFVLGVNYVRFSLDEIYTGKLEQREPGPVTLKSALEYFFDSYTHGILWCLPHAVAVWKTEDPPQYYMFEPHACGPTGLRLDGQDNAAACLLTFSSAKLMAFGLLQNYPMQERIRREFQLYAMTVVTRPIRRVGLFEPPLLKRGRGEGGAALVPATSKVGMDGRPRRAMEGARRHPPGDVTCQDAQRAALAADKENERQPKGQRNTSGWLVLTDGTQYMSAQHSIACRQFPAASRGKQALACAIMAVAMSRVEDVCRWCGSTLDDILYSGDQLYQDSYLHYRPGNKILTIEQILRKFYTPGNCACRVVVYKARQSGTVPDDLREQLMQFFREEKQGVLVTKGGEIAVALFRTCRGYYMFDPCDRDRYGRDVAPPCVGRARACFSQYPSVKALSEKLGANIPPKTKKDKKEETKEDKGGPSSDPNSKKSSQANKNETKKDTDTKDTPQKPDIKKDKDPKDTGTDIKKDPSIKETAQKTDVKKDASKVEGQSRRESKVNFAEEKQEDKEEEEEPTTFEIYGMDVTSLRRLNKHER